MAVSVRVASTMTGDLAPTSVNTVCASTTNESDGTPCTGAAGGGGDGPRMGWAEAGVKGGNRAGRGVRAGGTPPPTTRGGGGGGGGGGVERPSGRRRPARR